MDLLSVEEIVGRGMTKGQLMDYYGFHDADIALPQHWLNEMSGKLYRSADWVETKEEAYDFVRFHVVWGYEDGSVLGGPVFLSKEAKEKLEVLL